MHTISPLKQPGSGPQLQPHLVPREVEEGAGMGGILSAAGRSNGGFAMGGAAMQAECPSSERSGLLQMGGSPLGMTTASDCRRPRLRYMYQAAPAIASAQTTHTMGTTMMTRLVLPPVEGMGAGGAGGGVFALPYVTADEGGHAISQAGGIEAHVPFQRHSMSQSGHQQPT